MTDMISTLAEKLVALNNASPHLPRKEQIEAVLKAGMVANLASTSRDAFAPKLAMKVDPMTDNLIVTGHADDVEMGYAITMNALRNGRSVFNDIVEMHTKLEDSIWQALHCPHPSWVTSQFGGPDICMSCGRAKP